MMQIARVAASQQPVASTSAIASASAMLRLLNHHFNSAYQYAQLVFGPGGLRTREPSDADLLCVTVIQSLLEERKSRQLKCQQEDDKGESQAPDSNEAALADVRLAETRMLLKDCVALDSLLRVTDADGWNIVQAAAMNGDIELLDLLVAEGFDVNTAKCSLPLHVAAFLGNIELVDWLLARGADPAIERGMCFPDSHHPIRHVPSRFHFLETDIFACDAERHVAVMYAVQRDHVHVVRRFFSHADSSSQTYWLRSLFAQKRILHYACKQGAYHCLEYLVEQMNDELDTFDDDGFAPIHYAVRWSTRFVECLVNASINVHALSRNSQETALHRLFGDLQNPLDILETTTFLLGVGMEQKISVVDRNGNSVLHAAVSLVNRKLQSFPTMAVKEDDAHLMQQERYDNAVVAVLELLLQNNCDVGVVNSSSITALHKLLLIFDFVVSNEPAGVTLETLPVRENYKADLRVIYRAMDVLLRFGACPNTSTGAGRSPLLILLQSALNSEAGRMCQLADDLCACLELLCRHGARPSLTTATHVAVVSLIAKLGYKCLQQQDEVVKETAATFVCRVLEIVLNHGLDCNQRSALRRREVDGRSGSVLVELIRLTQRIRRPSDLAHIRRWVLTALQWGADPDMEPYPSEPIICHSQSSIFLRTKSTQPVHEYMFEIQDLGVGAIFEGGYAESLLLLFYNAMGHVPLYQCLSSARYMAIFDTASTSTVNRQQPSASRLFGDMVTTLVSQPRSLKQMARVAIYEALDRQLVTRVPHLPLPVPLKRYLLQVE